MLRAAIGLAVFVGLAGCTSPAAAVPSPAPSQGSIASTPASNNTTADTPTTGSGYKLPSPSPSPIGIPVNTQVLAPATVLPVVSLCSTPVIATADGNYLPLFCRSGAINVDAWRSYATSIGPHIMSAGRAATVQQITDALRADGAFHDTAPEQIYSYMLAAAYYGWNFSPNPACEFIYKTASCY